MLPRPVTHTHRSHTHTHTHTHTHVYPGEVDVEAWDAAEAGHGVLRRNHSKRGKTAEVLVAFVEELELVRLSAGHPHSQSVQNTVHVCVREAHLRQRLSHSQRLTNTTTQRNRTLLINVPCTKCFSQYMYVLQISKLFHLKKMHSPSGTSKLVSSSGLEECVSAVNGCRQNKNITVHQLSSGEETNPALRRL